MAIDKVCGKTIFFIACQSLIPIALALSSWPFGTASMPALMISAKYALPKAARAKIPTSSAENLSP